MNNYIEAKYKMLEKSYMKIIGKNDIDEWDSLKLKICSSCPNLTFSGNVDGMLIFNCTGCNCPMNLRNVCIRVKRGIGCPKNKWVDESGEVLD